MVSPSPSPRPAAAAQPPEQIGQVEQVGQDERVGPVRPAARPAGPAGAVPEPGGPLPQGQEKVRAVRAMFDAIAPRYDVVNRLMTFRMDVGWRRRTVGALALPPGSRVLDVACGTGDLCRELAGAGLRPVGLDLSHGMLAAARTTAPLVQADALHLPVPHGTADGVTCGFALRNLAALEPFLAEVARALRPGGRVGLLEVAIPSNPVLRWGHGVYFGKVVPLIGGLLSDPAAYRYLPRSVAYLPETGELLGMIRDAGFVDVTRRPLSGGIAQLLTATRTSTSTATRARTPGTSASGDPFDDAAPGHPAPGDPASGGPGDR